MRRRHYVWISFGSMVLAGATALACGDDDAGSATNVGVDAGGTPTDSGTQPLPDGNVPPSSTDAGDAGVSDAGGDAGSDADAAPTVTASIGPTGLIELADIGAIAFFYEDDTIVRASDSPECVGHLRSETKPSSPAGTITIGGDIVGANGGPATALEIAPDSTNFYFGPDLVFPADDALTLQVQMSATSVFPPLAVQTLKTPPAGTVVVSAPAKADAGDLDVPSDKDLAVAWTPPASTTGQNLYFRFSDIVGNGKRASISCHFPLAAGSGRVPASLLSYVRNWLGGEAVGLVLTQAAGANELAAGGASYVIFTARTDSTTLSYSENYISAKLK
jgi:hypothetical protein